MVTAIAGMLLTAGTWRALAQEKSTPGATAKVSALKVKHANVYNAADNPARLRGISFSWSIWGGRKYYNADVVKWLKEDFNVNLIRVSMAIEPEHGYLSDPAGQEKLITSTVDAAIKEGLYVLIDWHDHHANANLQQSRAFFAKIAKKYAGVPNVIYEVWNEPERVAWDTVKNYAIQIIQEIRKYDKDNIIVVGSPSWDQDVDVAAKDPITGFSNIAYSFHFYASDPGHQERLTAKADEALRLKLPLFVTEWGVGEANGDGVFDKKKTNKWLNWMERNELSWANWNITDKAETTAILVPGASEKGNWTAEQLTPAGAYIREVLRRLNK
jgi:endoglucanase